MTNGALDDRRAVRRLFVRPDGGCAAWSSFLDDPRRYLRHLID
jgi:hypothetical protein